MKTTNVQMKATVLSRDHDCYIKEWSQLLSAGMKMTGILRNEDDCYLHPGLKMTVISRNEDDCYIQGSQLLSQGMNTTVICRDEDDLYPEKWRQLLFPGMKTTVISRNEEDCYLEKWRLLSPGMKTTVISRKKHRAKYPCVSKKTPRQIPLCQNKTPRLVQSGQPRITAPRALVSEKNTAPRTKHRARCPYVARCFILIGHQARCLVRGAVFFSDTRAQGALFFSL